MTNYLFFNLAGPEPFAIPVCSVREIVTISEIHKLPGSSDMIVGCMNVRGVVIPVIDLPSMLFSRPTPLLEGMVIILDLPNQSCGFKVSGVKSISKLDVGVVERSATAKHFVNGVSTQEDGTIVQILNVDKILARIAQRNVA
ncbi:chemotaxis protein CheW [Pseudomonas syringae pv. actinidiae]|uniref:chemotaxis protein CheW n=1 Tax=Pseudomonas viridiflava TaxID=33069 RepID=UPI0018E62483|nr:chemotaxis protein CheW [Pseudomonas viridiflava]MDU8352926.1 chemotaxis protein CheW [Pseudomonas syringae pv. actinidiae]